MLYEEIISHQEKSKHIYRKEAFIEAIGKDTYKQLQRSGVLTVNKKARFDLDKCDGLKFAANDSIITEDLTSRIGVTKAEATRIMSELVKQNVIVKQDNGRYSLGTAFDKIENITIPFCPLYEDAARRVLFHCFSYRIYLQMIIKHKKDEEFTLRPFLAIKPHQTLVRELLAMRIITSSTVNTSRKDIKSLLNNLYNTKSSDFAQMFKNMIQANPLFKRFLTDFAKISSKMLEAATTDDNPKSKLSEEDVIKFIARTLERSGSTLEALDTPDGSLQNILEVVDISSSAEVYIFILDGLEHIVKLEEKKWTWKMIFNTVIVILMGIAQITIGVLIELYSVGVMTHVGSAFISEGIGDLFFALGALKSGHFSWGDYWKQKIESVVLSAATAGLAGWLSRGTKVSRFGHKLFGPSFALKGEKMVETCGRNLIKIVGHKEILKQVGKRIGLKIMEGVFYGASNMVVDSLVSNYLQSLTDQIASKILSDIENQVSNHRVMSLIEEAYATLGEERTKEMVQTLTENAFTEEASSGFFSSIRQFGSVLSQGLAQATKKNSKVSATTSGSAMDNFHVISEIMFYLERLLTLTNAASILTDFLNDMEKSVRTQMNGAELLDERQELGEDYRKFQQEIQAQWITAIRQKMSQIVSTEVVSPILKQGANRLIGFIGNQIKKAYNAYLEIGYNDEFNKIKRKYRKKVKKAKKLKKKRSIRRIKKKYHKALLGVTKKTRSPALFAKIFRENVPMDLTCVKASIHVAHALLNQMGGDIGTLKFVVKGENGVIQEFVSEQNGTNMKCVEIDLHNNHFDISGSGDNQSQSNTGRKNNCLFEALSKDIPILKTMKSSEFRNRVADWLEKDPDIHYHLKQGWHRMPIELGMYGGYRRPTKRVEHYQSMMNRDGTFDEEAHILSRFTFTIEVAGVARRVCQQTKMKVDDLIIDGRSQGQDRNSGMGKDDVHAAHLVKCQLPGAIFNDDKPLDSCKELINMLGHTQNVHKYVNMAGTVGRSIDDIQYELIRIAADIDYGKRMDDTFHTKINNIRNKMVGVVNEYITKENSKIIKHGSAVDDQRKAVVNKLENVVRSIESFNSKALYVMGKKSYKGKSTKKWGGWRSKL